MRVIWRPRPPFGPARCNRCVEWSGRAGQFKFDQPGDWDVGLRRLSGPYQTLNIHQMANEVQYET